MIQFPNSLEINTLVGSLNKFKKYILTPFNITIIEFLNQLSKELFTNSKAKTYPDIISFAYWCRKGNILQLKNNYIDNYLRLPLGYIFHITPSNVPINFAFSFAFSLLAGNSNIVRTPSKNFPQIELVCESIKKVLKVESFKELELSNCIIKYEKNKIINDLLSRDCDGRIIWGGSSTISEIRKSVIPERSSEIIFADRYSFCTINADKFVQLNSNQLDKLLTGFYNDTYLMDQNACSSPHLIIWLGKSSAVKISQKQFWEGLYKIVNNKYDMESIHSIDKLNHLYQSILNYNNISEVYQFGNLIYVIDLISLPINLDEMRGQFGHFYQYTSKNMNEIVPLINKKYQTMTYFGFKKKYLKNFIMSNQLFGIDRIVPIGSGLDISIIWDGYDLINTFTRIIDIK